MSHLKIKESFDEFVCAVQPLVDDLSGGRHADCNCQISVYTSMRREYSHIEQFASLGEIRHLAETSAPIHLSSTG